MLIKMCFDINHKQNKVTILVLALKLFNRRLILIISLNRYSCMLGQGLMKDRSAYCNRQRKMGGGGCNRGGIRAILEGEGKRG